MAIPNAIDATEDENHLQPVAAPERTQPIAQGSNLGVQILYDAKDGLDAVVDIVFVHGLTGNADFLKDDIPDARILTFGYDADVVNWWEPASNNRIGNHAENLLGSLTRLRERTDTEERKIIFVMHSLGGLVVQNVLDLSRSNPARHLRNLEAATIGLAFLGTPHFGSDKAEWGAFGTAMLGLVKSTNTSIVQVLRPDSEMLSVIQKKFHEILLMRSEDLQVTCFHEELDVKGLGTIVKKQSASLPGRPSYGIHANHMSMVRFEHATDNGYEAIVGEILRWTKVARGTATESKDAQEECLRCLYFDGLESCEDEITQAIPGTFSWIWDPAECNFSQWVLRQDPTVYWIRGKVSSGKSTLMKHLLKPPSPVTLSQLNIDRLVIVSYYIDRSREHKQPMAITLCGIARAFIWKILRQDSRLFNLVIPQFRELQKGRPNFEWKLEVLQDILTNIVSKRHDYNLWLLLDGLDEYPTDRLEVTEISVQTS
ncbi:hypothetical protein CcaCcLH18_08385 [Colletotrichum camelliae]|nr:hypothetical protein CcaCcLH18_08385 [Colletotrichum camelliae]